MPTPSKYIWADRDLTALSDPRANPTRQIYKPRYARRAFGPPRFARNNIQIWNSLVEICSWYHFQSQKQPAYFSILIFYCICHSGVKWYRGREGDGAERSATATAAGGLATFDYKYVLFTFASYCKCLEPKIFNFCVFLDDVTAPPPAAPAQSVIYISTCRAYHKLFEYVINNSY